MALPFGVPGNVVDCANVTRVCLTQLLINVTNCASVALASRSDVVKLHHYYSKFKACPRISLIEGKLSIYALVVYTQALSKGTCLMATASTVKPCTDEPTNDIGSCRKPCWHKMFTKTSHYCRR